MFRACLTAVAGAGLAAVFFPVPATAGAAEALLAHRAVYDLDLKSATDRSGIDSMVGRMVYEFNGSACDGYTTRFRLVTQITSGGEKRLTDQQTTTYENPGDADLPLRHPDLSERRAGQGGSRHGAPDGCPAPTSS